MLISRGHGLHLACGLCFDVGQLVGVDCGLLIVRIYHSGRRVHTLGDMKDEECTPLKISSSSASEQTASIFDRRNMQSQFWT